MNITQLKNNFNAILKSGVTPVIVGAHGIGKSSVVAQLARDNGYQFIDLRLGLMPDCGDLVGLGQIHDDVTKFFPPAFLPTTGKGILFLDEFNRAPRDVLQAVFQLVLDKKVRQYSLPEGWHVVLAMNPPTDDYVVTDLSDEALKSRFTHIKLEPSVAEFVNYIGPDKPIARFIAEHPTLLDNAASFDLFSSIKPCRRSADFAQRLLDAGLTEDVQLEVLMGTIGTEAAMMFSNWLKSEEKVPTGEEIVAGKSKTKIAKAVETSRNAFVATACDNLEAIIKEKRGIFSAKEVKNIKAFLLQLPFDLYYGFLTKIELTNSLEPLGMDQDLLDRATKELKAGKGTKAAA